MPHTWHPSGGRLNSKRLQWQRKPEGERLFALPLRIITLKMKRTFKTIKLKTKQKQPKQKPLLA